MLQPIARLMPLARYMLLAGAALFSTGAPAQTSNVYIDRVPPLSFVVDGEQRGLLWDLTQELAHRVDYHGPVTPLPLKRQRILLSMQNDVIGTMWRYPENEEHYRWWVKLFDFSFYMVAAPDSTVDISSVAAARRLRVGVILGSPAEVLVRRLGFQHIETSALAEANARKLALGRIDIWVATPAVLHAVQASAGSQLGKPRVGAELGRLGLYLVSAPGFDPQQGAQWAAAFAAMQKDGSYLQIMHKYPGALP
ncbi:MAG: substrate-binding periplasmic protein [Sphingomonadaceae bacterium]